MYVCGLAKGPVVSVTSKLKPDSLHCLQLPYKSHINPTNHTRGKTHIPVYTAERVGGEPDGLKVHAAACIMQTYLARTDMY